MVAIEVVGSLTGLEVDQTVQRVRRYQAMKRSRKGIRRLEDTENEQANKDGQDCTGQVAYGARTVSSNNQVEISPLVAPGN
jgi:hypothetical protein